MPTGVAKSGRRARMLPAKRLGMRERAEIQREWKRNLEAIGFSDDDPEYWTPAHVSYHLREAGLPTQRQLAERYGVSTSQMSVIVSGLTRQRQTPPAPHPLTPTQFGVLRKLANGLRLTEIAIATGRSSTNMSYVMIRVRNKLQAHSDAHAVAIAVARGWITVEGA